MGPLFIWFLVILLSSFVLSSKSGFPRVDHFPRISSNPNDIHFHLFTSSKRPKISQEIRLLNESSLQDSGFIPNVATMIFLHGYFTPRQDGGSPLITAYLKSGIQGNFLAVDWKKLNKPKLDKNPAAQIPEFIFGYAEVVQNIPIVSNRVAEFIDWLIAERALSLDKLHLIGFSLGAHVMGGVGRRVQELRGGERVRRITGLDPAGPLLQFPIKLKKTLDREDGNFVDIIHTSVGLYGTIERNGDVDFYANNGIVQPGCLGPVVVDCSHYYALKIYAKSISKRLTACKCYPWKFWSCHHPCHNPTIVGPHCPETVRGSYHLINKPT